MKRDILSILGMLSMFNISMANEVPLKNTALLWEPYAWQIGEHTSHCLNATQNHGYATIKLVETDYNNIPTLTVLEFKSRISSSDYGILWICTHGSKNGIGIEVYRTSEEMWDKIEYYNEHYGWEDDGYIYGASGSAEGQPTGYHISVTPKAVEELV